MLAASPVRMSQLSAVAGVQLSDEREMLGNAYVLGLPDKLPVSEVRTITDKLMTLDDVEYAEPDRILQHTLTPNDPQYTNQWHYYEIVGHQCARRVGHHDRLQQHRRGRH